MSVCQGSISCFACTFSNVSMCACVHSNQYTHRQHMPWQSILPRNTLQHTHIYIYIYIYIHICIYGYVFSENFLPAFSIPYILCVAACCSVRAATHCNAVCMLQWACCNTLQCSVHVAVCVLQHTAMQARESVYLALPLYSACCICCSVLQCVVVCCSVLQCTAVCCSVLQCVAACCSVRASPLYFFEFDCV